MSDITKKSLTEIVNLIKNKEIKSEEVTASFIENIKKDKKLNSFITNCSEQALEKAKSFDKNPKLDNLLPGVPIAVKDLFCTEGVKTTAGSKML
jgi:aspartyl-tRNA(Asn)/glutamyl-tRNA(Gln) amidotransferase subunit A